MKILVFYQYFGTPKGNYSTRIYELVRRWVDKGHQVTVITAPYKRSDIQANGFITKTIIDGIEVIVINAEDSNSFSLKKRAINALLFAITASYHALRIKSDVVIASSGPITIGFPALVKKWFSKTPIVFEVRDLWPGGAVEMKKIKNKVLIKLTWRFERLIYRNASYVVPASPGMEANILDRFNDLETFVIPNASDNELFENQSKFELPDWAVGKKLFPHIGSIGFINNCGLIIEAAQEISKRNRDDILILFIGDGPEKGELETRTSELGLQNVKFIGSRPKTELVGWVQNSTATVFTTLNNPIQDTCSPNKVFDSFAAGIPVIQNTSGWIKDLFEKSRCGLNTIPDDPVSLANAIVDLADNSDLRVELGKNAKGQAMTSFNRDLLATKYLEKIKSLCHI